MNTGLPKTTLLVISLLMLSGCASLFEHQALNYETISADPLHNTKGAIKANQKALELWANDEIGRAEAQFKKALAADVTYGPAHNNLGKLYFVTGNLYLAAWEFEYATKLIPDRPEPYNNLGLVLEIVGRLDEAIEAFEKAYALAPTNAQFVGNLARARLRKNENDPMVRVLLGELLLVDTRPDWLHWAREKLALGPMPCPASNKPISPTHTHDAPGMAEVVPLPPPEKTPPMQAPIIDFPIYQEP